MKVLLVASSFPPDPIVGALRPFRLVSLLVASGHSLEVVTGTLPAEVEGPRKSPWGSVNVHAVRIRRTPLQMANSWYQRSRPIGGGVEPREDGGSNGRAIVRDILRRQLLPLLRVPDPDIGFVAPALKQALELSSEKGPFDLIYTTAPSHATSLCGLRLARKLQVPWAMELRDPWITGDAGAGRKVWWERAVLSELERTCVRKATLVVTTSHSLAEQLRTRFQSASVLAVLNGIPSIPSPKAAPPPRALRVEQEPFVIVHAGSIYGGRDPSRILQAMALLQGQERRAPDVRLQFLGLGDSVIERCLAQDARRIGVDGSVEVLPAVPYSDIMAVMRNCGLLLLLAQGQPSQVPNKLYDYLAVGKPILAIADAGGETETMLRAVGGHDVFPVNADPAQIAESIRTVMTGRESGASSPNVELLASWTTEAQLGRLVQELEQLSARGLCRLGL